MEWLFLHPLALWLVVGAAFLAVEVSTESGWLLWPAGSAVVTGALARGLALDMYSQLIVFAALTIASTLAGRHFFPRPVFDGPDINDTVARLTGSSAYVVEAFRDGQGRVALDGKEWAADLVEGHPPQLGAQVTVLEVLGARLKVRSR